MTIAATVQRYLEDCGIDYEVVEHARTLSSSRTAEMGHVSGDRLAKADGSTIVDLGSGGNDHAINKANAAYGSVKYRPVDRAELSAGLRYTKDDRSTVEPGPAPAVSTFYQYNAHNVSYDASASYKFTGDILGYVRYATGYLSGGVMDGAYLKPEKTSSVTAAPPSTWRRSSTSTRRPALARYAAATSPLCPPPTMMTSESFTRRYYT